MLGEDIQDQLRAVKHRALQCTFQIAVLRRCQVVVKQHEVAVLLGCPHLDFCDLANSQES